MRPRRKTRLQGPPARETCPDGNATNLALFVASMPKAHGADPGPACNYPGMAGA